MTTATQSKIKTTAIKTLPGEGRVGGYLVVWGDASRKDLQGEYFTPDTDLALDWYPRRPALYHHGLDDTIKSLMAGQIDVMTPDDTGLWVEAQLDMRDRYVRAIYQLAQQGKLGWSSGSLPHLVEVERDGKITRWPIIEGSMTPSPAEPRHTEVSAKHLCDAGVLEIAYKSAGLIVPDLLKPDSASEGEPREGQAGEGDAVRVKHATKTQSTPMEENATMTINDVAAGLMTEEQVLALWEKKQKEAEEVRELEVLKAKAARTDALETENATLKAQTGKGQPAKRLPGREEVEDGEDAVDPTAHKGQIVVGSKFDNLTVEEMAYGVTVLQQMGRLKGVAMHPSEQYAKALTHKIAQRNLLVQKPDDPKSFYKSDELSYSTQASYGDEWVPDLWSSELWRRARLENVILPLFRSIEMPSNPFELPIQGTDPTTYFVPETEDETQLTISGSGNAMPDSKVGTGKVTLTAKKFAVRVGFSAELVEDSLIPVLPLFTEQALRSMSDALDNVLLNGDTEAGGTGNINSDDGAPGATAKYMAFNGLRKLGLVTNTTNKADAAGAPTMANLRAARFLMAAKYSINPRNLAWIVDGSTYAKLLSLPEVMTMDKFGPNATAMTGQLAMVDGIPLLVSAEAPLTMADGKVDSTGNTKGQATCVYRPGWMIGYRRRVTATSTYLPYYDAWQLIATVRLAFINFDTDVASTLYNVTV